MFDNIILDYTHMKEFLVYVILTLSLSIYNNKTTFIIYLMIMNISLIFRYYNFNLLGNIFIIYFSIILIAFLINFNKGIKIMEIKLEKLSNSIEFYGKENLILDIVNSTDKIDAEYLINHYKIKINGEKSKYIKSINKIIIYENFRLCKEEEMRTRITEFIDYIKKEDDIYILNSIYMTGFTPSNSMIKFYIKLISIKRELININKSLESEEYFNTRINSILSTLNNKLIPIELLNFTYVINIPNYKLNDPRFFKLIDDTIDSIENYIKVYNDNNLFL